MTPHAIEIFRRATTMMAARGASTGDAMMLAAMFLSFVRQEAALLDAPVSREEIERDILALSYEADAFVIVKRPEAANDPIPPAA